MEVSLGAILLKEETMAVKIRVSADTSAARRDLSRLEQSVNSIDKTAKNVTRSLTRLAQGIATAFGTAVAVKSINRATDSLVNLENRIALVTGRTQQLNKSLDNLYAIARQSRQPVDLAAETFNRFGLALRDANVSVEEIEKATLAVQRSVALSGGNIESARAAIFQLGQGLASGTLRGQELNSVLEQAPRIATAIADDLNVGVGALREMAADGKITTDVVFNALLNQSSKLEEEFQALEQTSSQAFVVFNDTLQRTIGNISRVLGITQAFTDTFNDLTDILLKSSGLFELELYAGIAGFNDALYDTQLILGGVLNVTRAFSSRFADFIGNIIGPTEKVLLQLRYVFLEPILFIENQYSKLGKTITDIFESSIFKGTKISAKDIFFAESAEDARKKLDQLSDDITKYGRRFYNFGYQIQSALEPAINTIDILTLRIGILLKRLNIYKVSILDIIGSFGLLDKVTQPINDLFDSFSQRALDKLSVAKNFIVDTLETIERAFFWLYDKVIGNSWWTDTMEQTYSLAQEYLGKTINTVKSFSNTVVTEYRKAFQSAKDSLAGLSEYSSLSNLNIKIDLKQELSEFLDDPKSYIVEALSGVLNNIGKPISNAVSILYRELTEVYPVFAGIVAAVFGSYLVGIFSASLAAGMRRFISLGIIASLGGILAASFGDDLLDSGVIKNFARGLGQAAGAFVDVIISNIPEIIRAFGQIVVGFGEGLADSLGGVFGLMAKLIMSLPIINIIPGLISGALLAYFTGFGPKKLVDNFIKDRQKQFDSASKNLSKSAKKASNSVLNTTPQISFIESVLIGRGGGRRTLAKSIGLITAVDTALGVFFGNSAFTDAILAGGFIADLLLGNKGTKFVASQVNSLFNKIKQSASSINNVQGLKSFLSQLNPSSIVSLWQSSMFRAGQAVGAFVKFTNIRMVALQVISKATALVTQNSLVSAFRTIQSKTNNVLNFISRKTRRVVLGTVVAAFTFWASSASAATEDINKATTSVFDNILNGINNFLASPLGFFTTLILGGSAGGAAGAFILKKVGTILGKVGAKIATFVGATKAAKAGALSLAILGEGSLIAGVTTVLAGVGKAIAAFIASTVGIVASVGALAGLIGVALFGEGDSIGERFRNAENSVRRFFGYASRESTQLRKSLEDSLGGFDKIGQVDVNFKPFLDSFRFEDIDAEETKRLQRIAEKTNKILSSAQQSIERGDELSRSETRRVKRAVDIAKAEIVAANLGVSANPSDSASTSGLTTRLQFVEPLLGAFAARDTFNASAATKIARTFALADDASADLVASFKTVENAIKSGDVSSIGMAISDILRNPSIVAELETSVSGSTLVKTLQSIMRVTSGSNLENIDPSQFDKIYENISRFGRSLDKSDLSLSSSISGTIGQDLGEKVGDEISKNISDAVLDVMVATQSRRRAVAEEKFLKAAEKANDLFGTSFDLSDIDDSTLAALSTKTLDDVTSMIEKQTFLSQQAMEKELEGANQNVLSDTFRQQFLARQNAVVQTLQETVFGALGVFNPNGEVKDEVVTRLASLNERLDELEIDALKVLPESQVSQIQDDEQAATTANSRILSQLNKISTIQSEIAKTDQGNTSEINKKLALLNREKALLEIFVSQVNARALAEVDRIAAIEDALEKVDNAKDLDEALAIDPKTITRALNMNKALELIRLTMKRIQLDGIEGVDSSIINALRRQADKLKGDLEGILSNPDLGNNNNDDKSSGGAGQTPFEKFVDGLNSAGFGLTLEDAARLGAKAFQQLKSPVSQILELNKKITNSSLDDTKARRAAVAEIKNQRKEIFKVLSLGTLGDKQKAFEAFGADPAMALESAKAQEIALNLVELRQRLVQVSAEDIIQQRQITSEISRQEYLLDALVNKSEEAANSIQSAFSTGFKQLLKGETTIKGFFKGLLDAISNQIIDTVVDSFTQAFFEASGLKEMFTKLFEGLFSMGDSVGLKVGGDFSEGFAKASEGISQDGTGGFFGNLSSGFKSLFSNLGGMFKNIFSGLLGTGGGGGLFSSLFGISFGGFLGLNGGGIVPRTSYSRDGVDSVPAMLTPGELVVPANKVKEFGNNNNSNTVVNLSITGDVSRQTRQEIVKMLPTIANGVNAQNKERNFKYR